VSYFTSNGVALHGAYWHNNFGVPSSHGCVNMTPQAAKWIYRWTMPTVPPENYYYSADSGTRVIVQ
jgi:lipoprotein-anchoring transpeptidase ErfK/SrfK